MSKQPESVTTQKQEIDKLIEHLRKQPQICREEIGGWSREFKSDASLCADYLERLKKYVCGINENPDFDFDAAFGD